MVILSFASELASGSDDNMEGEWDAKTMAGGKTADGPLWPGE